ncbi:MAG: hypothetical protein OEU92_27895 [Alphaproteobacteria bacterium]|nr:hypothetical protein [Alphaproteobacteria bacterium]
MALKTIQDAQKPWRKLDRQNQSPKVIEGIKFINGAKAVRDHAAASADAVTNFPAHLGGDPADCFIFGHERLDLRRRGLVSIAVGMDHDLAEKGQMVRIWINGRWRNPGGEFVGAPQ